MKDRIRNIVIGLIIIFFIGVGSVLFFIFSIYNGLKNSPAYKTSIKFIKNHPIVKEEVGKNLKFSYFPTIKINVNIQNGKYSGNAYVNTSAKGQLSEAEFEIHLIKTQKNGKWKIKEAYLYKDKEKILLPTQINAKKLKKLKDIIIFNTNSIIKKSVMAKNYTPDNEPIDKGNIFSPTDKLIVCCIYVKGLDREHDLRAVWNILDLNGKKTKISSQNLKLPPDNNKGYWATFYFKLNPGKQWPKGSYQIDLYIDDVLDRSITYYVK